MVVDLMNPTAVQDAGTALGRYWPEVAGWFVFYWLALAAVRASGFARRWLPEGGLTAVRQWRAENTLVSLGNSLVQSVWTVPLWLAMQLGAHATFSGHVEHFVCCFLGYNLYDFVAMAVVCRGALFRAEPALIVHHAVVTASLLGSMIEPYTMYYQVVATLCEVNSLFLHSRALLRMLGDTPASRRWQAAIRPLQHATYVVFRLASSGYLVWAGYRFTEHSPLGGYGWLTLAVLLFTINAVYYRLLIRSDFSMK